MRSSVHERLPASGTVLRIGAEFLVSINDHPEIRRVFEGFHFEKLDIRYSNTNQRYGKAEISGELVIMNWQPAGLGLLF